jgi:hypothetical protein
MPHNHYGHSLFNRRHQSEGTFIPALMQLMHGKEVAGWPKKSASRLVVRQGFGGNRFVAQVSQNIGDGSRPLVGGMHIIADKFAGHLPI